MTNDFRSYNVIYIIYDRKNENHWHYSLFVTHYLEYKHPALTLKIIHMHIQGVPKKAEPRRSLISKRILLQ